MSRRHPCIPGSPAAMRAGRDRLAQRPSPQPKPGSAALECAGPLTATTDRLALPASTAPARSPCGVLNVVPDHAPQQHSP